MNKTILKYIIISVAILLPLGLLTNFPSIRNDWGFYRFALHNYITGTTYIWSEISGRFIEITRVDRSFDFPQIKNAEIEYTYKIDKGIGYISIAPKSSKIKQINLNIIGYDDHHKLQFSENETISFENIVPVVVTCNGFTVATVDCIPLSFFGIKQWPNKSIQRRPPQMTNRTTHRAWRPR